MRPSGRPALLPVLIFVVVGWLVPSPVRAGAPLVEQQSEAAARPVMRVIGATTIPVGNVVRGIDVSHWQGVIDWPTVASVGVSFAYLKATEGTGWTDDRFAGNRAAATQAGILVGAYHYARPSPALGDAVREADHFLDVVAPRVGELHPALDLEETGGLEPAELNGWVLGFIARVRERTGVTPVIYTSPRFWVANLADSPAAAVWGGPLWLAHWDTAHPHVPGEDWLGRGWTVWQWTDRGLVPGIDGRVDLDVVPSSALGDLTLR
jgi:GH25 family lysozyme M1 (1,4-beta-N-acetylmuramidase)